MKKIIEFLETSGIDFRIADYGGSYFDDERKNCVVSGLLVSFDSWIDPDAVAKKAAFMRLMARSRAFVAVPICSHGIYSFRVLSVFDSARLERYDRDVSAAVDAFWIAEHARRLKAASLA